MIILSLDTKKCMSSLLLKPDFDHFSLIEGEITTYNKFSIDGFLHKDFYEEAPDHEYSYWKELREYCFSLIRGKRTPLNFKFVFSLASEDFAAFLKERDLTFRAEDIQGMSLNFRYDGTRLSCVTGTSMKTFTMDKSLEQAWDGYVKGLFDKFGIGFECEA